MSTHLQVPLSQVINTPNWRLMVGTYKYLGLWPPPPNDRAPNHHRWLYLSAAFVLHSCCTLLYVSTMLINIVVNQNINDLYITLTELGMLVKCGHFLRRHLLFQAFVDDLFTNPVFSLRGPTEQEIYARNLRHYRLIVNGYMSFCLLFILLAGGSAMFSDPIALSYPAWFPFDYSSSRNLAYYLIFVYQNGGMAMHCMMNLTWDCLMPFLMVNLSTQFEILGHRMRNGFAEPRNPMECRQELVRNIEHYNALVRFNRELERAMSLPLAWQINITGIVLCVTMMQLVTVGTPIDDI